MIKIIKYTIIIVLLLLWLVFIGMQLFPLEFRSHPVDIAAQENLSRYTISHQGSWIESEGSSKDLIPVVALYGTPGSADNYIEIFNSPYFSRKFKGYAIDRLGFGYNQYGDRYFNIDEQAEFISNFINQHIDQPLIILAHSYGVPVALHLAEFYPDLAKKLILVAGPVSAQFVKSGWYRPILKLAGIRHLLPESLHLCNVEMHHLPHALEQIEQNLDNIEIPITVIHGQKDMLVDFKNAILLKEQIPEKVKLISLTEANHFIPWTRLEIILDELDSSDR